MASSRKTRRRADEPLREALARQLAALRGAVPDARIAVAVSGGPDSVALLDALCAAGARPVAVLTIHHGLSPEADAWVECAAGHARRLGIAHLTAHAGPIESRARGLEEAARIARYAALEALCARCGADVLALAHHLDDLAETVLLQALRGSGPAGLAAMPVLQRLPLERPAPAPAGPTQPASSRLSEPASESRQATAQPAPWLAWRWRPLLDVPRAELEAYVARHALRAMRDPSNDDTRFARNALRHRVLPVIGQHFPAYRRTLARLAGLAAQAESMLDEVAHADLQAVSETHAALGETLRRSRWLALSAPRRARVLRLWLARAGLRAPSQARLAEMQRQLERAAPDAAVMLTHQHRHVRRWRDWIVLDADAPAAQAQDGAVPVAWQDGQPRVELPALYGVLLVEPESREGAWGVAHGPLAAGGVSLRARRGRERIRLSPDGPARTLKNVFQERGVPAWRRARLPVALQGERLLWVAEVGFDARVAVREGRRYGLRWEPIG